MESTQVAPGDKDVTVSVKGHVIRVRFETIALTVIVGVVIVGCLIGFYSNDLAERVVKLKDAITDFLSVLTATIGLSFGRGHMDKRVDAQNKDQ